MADLGCTAPANPEPFLSHGVPAPPSIHTFSQAILPIDAAMQKPFAGSNRPTHARRAFGLDLILSAFALAYLLQETRHRFGRLGDEGKH
jgi:hypothetical protein